MANQKAQIPTVTTAALAQDVRTTMIAGKKDIRTRLTGRSSIFNNMPPVLPNLDDGCEYYEFAVGSAHANDPRGLRRKRRLVIEVVAKPRQVRET